MRLDRIEARLAGTVWLQALLLAILVGTAVRTDWTPGHRLTAGIDVSAKVLLEVAVLLGVSVSARTVLWRDAHTAESSSSSLSDLLRRLVMV